MPSLSDLLPHDDPRVAILRDGDTAAAARCVLLWAQRAQRATGNLAANLAIELADDLGVPVIAVFALSPGFPRATLRAYHFMAEGIDTLPDAFAQRHIGWELRVGQPPHVVPAAAKDLAAALVVTDLNPLRIGRQWREAVGKALNVPLVQVDTDTVVPSSLFPKAEYAPRTIRPKIMARLDEFLHPIDDPRPKRPSKHHAGPRAMTEIAKPSFELNRDVGPSEQFAGGTDEARKRLKAFVARSATHYDDIRQRADLDQTSHLSPYLHYGQIAPTEVVLAVRDAVSGPVFDAFVNEIIVQRELAINYALRVPHYDAYQGLPDWGRDALERHAKDERPVTYTVKQLAASETHDALWNAAMRQMVMEGFLPNRLRLYWAKQIVLWSRTPQAAWHAIVELNDTYFLDGRDANSYANIAWVVGGRHDRPFPQERPITGNIRPMTIAAMKRSFRPEDYIARIDKAYGVPAAKPAPDDGAGKGSGKEAAQKQLDGM